MRDDGDFITDLRKQIMQSQDRRFNFIRQKSTFVISFLGIGSISFVSLSIDMKIWILLYLAPIIALVYDFYIIGESFNIKRMGVFIRECPKAPFEEGLWEICISKNRPVMPKIGMMVSTILVLLAAMLVLWIYEKVNIIYILWVIINFSTLFVLWQADKQNNKKIKNFENCIIKERENMSGNK